MAKKCLALFLALIMALSLLPVSAFAEDVEETKYLASAETSFTQKNLFAEIGKVLTITDGTTSVYITGGSYKDPTAVDSTVTKTSSGRGRSLTDGESYEVTYGEDKTSLGSFTFCQIKVELQNGKVDIRDLSRNSVLNAVLTDDIRGRLAKLGATTDDLTVEYRSYESWYSRSYDKWATLDNTDTDDDQHLFGEETPETIRVSWNGASATAALTIEDTRSVTTIATEDYAYEGNLYELAVKSVDDLKTFVFENLVTEGCTENVTLDALTVEYQSGSSWVDLDPAAFGDDGELTVRFTFAGDAEWKPAQESAVLTLTDTDRESATIVFKESLAFPFNETLLYDYYGTKRSLDEIEFMVFDAVVESSTPEMKGENALAEGVSIQYNCASSGTNWQDLDYSAGSRQHDFGANDTETIRITFAGNAEFKPLTKTLSINTADNRQDTVLKVKSNPTYEYDFYQGLPINVNALRRLVFGIVVDTENSTENVRTLSDALTIEYLAHEKDGILDSDKWRALDDLGTESGCHKFGAQTSEKVRLLFTGNDKYKPMSKTVEVTITFVDTRTPSTITAKEGASYAYYRGIHNGMTLEQMQLAVYKAVVAKSPVKLINANGSMVDGAKIEYYIYNTYNYGLEEYWKPLTFTDVGSSQHLFGANDIERIRISYAGDKTCAAFSQVFELPTFDPRDVPNLTEKGGDYVYSNYTGKTVKAADIFNIIVESTDPATTDEWTVEYKKSSNNWVNVDNATFDNNNDKTIRISYEGKGENYSKYQEKSWTFTLTLNDISDPNEVDGGIYGVYPTDGGFTVVATPEVSTSSRDKYSYYTASIVVTKNDVEIACSGELVNELVVKDAEPDECDITVTFEKAGLELNSDVELNKNKVRNADGSYNEAFTETLFAAVFNADASKPAGLTADDVTIEYKAGLTNLTWEPLDFEKSLYEPTMHNFGANNTETIRVSYSLGGNTFTKETTITLADLRQPTVLTCSNVSALYSNINSAIASKAKLYVADENGNPIGEPIPFTSDEIEISSVNANLTASQEVTVTFKGNSDYKSSTCKISATVLYGLAQMKVSSKIMQYEPGMDNSDLLAGMIKTTPADLDYVTIINGVDSSVKGFVSIDFPKSVQDKMKILGFIDFYEILSNLMGNGVSMSDLGGIIANLTEQMAPYSDQIGIDLNAFSQILDVLQSIPSIFDTKVYLGKAPKDAGLYFVNVICTDPNYVLSVGVGQVTILPLSRNLELKFNTNSVLKKSSGLFSTTYEVSYEDFVSPSFNSVCGATLKYNGKVVDDANLTVTYTGLADDLALTMLDSTGKPTKSGTYIQTVSASSNYAVMPITRTIKVLPAVVVIESPDKQTFTYDGKAHAPVYKAYLKAEGNPAVPAEEVTITYKQASTGLFGGLKNLLTKASTTAPVEVGTYEATISYNGNSSVKKTVTLVIAKSK